MGVPSPVIPGGTLIKTPASAGTVGQVPQIAAVDGALVTLGYVTLAGGGDMLVATYDPTAVGGDAFDMANMVEATDAKVLTAAERSLIASALQSTDIDTLAELNSLLSDATLIDTTDSRLSDARTPTAHNHAASAVTSGTFDDARIAASNVTQHQAALSITESQISDLGTYQPTSAKGQANGYASLDGNGLLPVSQLPPIAISEKLADAADQTAMLALSGQKGDWTIRTDTGTVWIISGDDPTQLSDWTQVSYPASPVTTVAGRTGDVLLSTSDISGLGTAALESTTAFATAAQGDLADSALQAGDIGSSVQAWSAVLDATTASFTTDDETKLDNIEAAADVTDEANVTASFPISDATALVKDPADGTKRVRIDVGTVSTATTRVITVPDADVNLGLVGSAVQPGDLATVATTGAYSDLSGTPTLGTAAAAATTDFAPALGVDDNYVTDAEKTVIGNTSGTNTGDQDLSGYALTSSLGTAAANDIGDFEAAGAVSTHAAVTSGVHGISAFAATVLDDADAATARATLGVDAAGTDNSTDVTLAGTPDYLTISGQEITLGSVDLTTDVTGALPAANGGTGQTSLAAVDLADFGSGAATDGYVATADGAGGVAWEAVAGGTIGDGDVTYAKIQQASGTSVILGVGEGDWWAGWAGYVTLTSDSSAITATPTHVIVDLSVIPSGSQWWTEVDSDGDDIRIRDAAGNEVPFKLIPNTFSTTNHTGELVVDINTYTSLSTSVDKDWDILAGKASAAAPSYTPFSPTNSPTQGFALAEDPSGSAPQMVDFIGGNNGTCHGGMTSGSLVNGKMGKGLFFSRPSSQYVTAPVGSLDTTGDYTVMLWANVDASASSGTYYAVFSVNGATYPALMIDKTGGNKWRALTTTNGTSPSYNYIESAGAPTYGQWYHLAVTVSGTTMSFYIDGSLVSTKTITKWAATSNVMIGGVTWAGTTPDSPFLGIVDGVRIWSGVALTASEIATIHANEDANDGIWTAGSWTAETPADLTFEELTLGSGLQLTGTTLSATTHTGEVTGSTSLTLDKTAITNKTAVQVESADYVVIGDSSDANNLKKGLVSSFPLRPPDAIIEDQQTAGVAGPAISSGSWVKLRLNTEVTDALGLISLSSNDFAVSANGWINWTAFLHMKQSSRTKIYCTTTASDVAFSGTMESADWAPHHSGGWCAVEAGKTYRLYAWGDWGTAGATAGWIATEVYARILYWRT